MSTQKIAAVLLTMLVVNVLAAFDVKATSLASPPRKCEIRETAWCIDQEASQITDRIGSGIDGRVWTIFDIDYPDSKLVVIEPSGCRRAFADTVVALGFEEAVTWQGEVWDRMQVRLRVDGSCDLSLLVPLPGGTSIEWAFSNGRTLITACRDDKCTPMEPTPADVTDQFREQFSRSSGSRTGPVPARIEKQAEHSADMWCVSNPGACRRR
jgi:hypothetical protein